MEKKGQVTIFVIIGIVIVAFAVLVYLFYPKISSTFGFTEETPSSYIQKCVEDSVKNSIGKIATQGGSLDPENYYLYKDQKLEYLCYTNLDYLTCVMQQPMLKKHFEEEIAKDVQGKVQECVQGMKTNFKNKGYDIQVSGEGFAVEILPKRINLKINQAVSLTKAEESQKYEFLSVGAESEIYELISIAESILNWEASYGSAETTIYMNYYHNLKVEKLKQSDGTTVYILTNRDSGEKFQFASRSIAWPSGYGATAI
ncbi:MAG: hypothetical protein AABW88_02400 [Nanoarchaeota archaeon]